MIYFKWTSAIETGHPAIDEQHKRLFVLGRIVAESTIKSGDHKLAAAHLQAFIVSAKEHFEYEESLMFASGYLEAERHAKNHASLLTELTGHRDKVVWGWNADPEGLNSFLWNWLILQIDIADRELVLWLKSH